VAKRQSFFSARRHNVYALLALRSAAGSDSSGLRQTKVTKRATANNRSLLVEHLLLDLYWGKNLRANQPLLMAPFHHVAELHIGHLHLKEPSRTGIAKPRSDRCDSEQPGRDKVVSLVSRTIFVSLLGLILFTAIPYGTDGTRWEAPFEIAVFMLAILSVLDSMIRRTWPQRSNLAMVIPLAGLLLLATLQVIPLSGSIPLVGRIPVAGVSADPYETRLFIFKLLALIITALLINQYCSTHFRLRALIHTIIIVGVASALFGLLRQTTQHSPGFILPALNPGEGYAQFFNRNHFAFLMEMALGLCLGLLAARSVTRDRVLLYIALAAPMWVAVILSLSRGGILSIFAQLVFVTIFWSKVHTTTRIIDWRRGPWQRFSTITNSPVFRALMVLPLLSLIAFTIFWVGGEPLSKRLQAIELGEDGTTISEIGRDPGAGELRENTTRFDIWKATLRLCSANPLAGVGFGGYSTSIPQYHDASGLSVPREAHNDYLELLASAGLFGGIFAAWFMIVLIRRSAFILQSANPFRRGACLGALAGIFAVSIHSFVDFGLHITINALVLIVLAMIATVELSAADRQPRREI